MRDALVLLWPSLLAAFCLVGIHAYFGIQVLTRNVIFVDLALAQIAALGATVAFMLGHPPTGLPAYGYSLPSRLPPRGCLPARARGRRASRRRR
jgi:zinc/manganese transport system permease protein